MDKKFFDYQGYVKLRPDGKVEIIADSAEGSVDNLYDVSLGNTGSHLKMMPTLTLRANIRLYRMSDNETATAQFLFANGKKDA